MSEESNTDEGGDGGGSNESDKSEGGDKKETLIGGKDDGKTDDKNEKGDEGTGDKGKTSDSEKSEAVDYSGIKLPKDSALSESDQSRLTEYAKANNLSKEATKSLLEAENSAREKALGDFENEKNEQIKGWIEDVKKDPEIGGDNYSKSVELARQAVDRFGGDAFKKILNDTGYGNHKEVIRAFAKIGKAMSDDTLVKGNTGDNTKSTVDLFYGKKD